MSAVLEEDEVDARIVRLESDVAHIRSDISDIKSDIRELRAESSSHTEGLGSIRVEIANLRDELHTGLADGRAEMHAGDERLHRLIIRTSLTDRIWMLTLTGTMLAVMAHGFKWI